MKINHIGMWVTDLEKMKEFYCREFNGTAGNLYENKTKGFSSYFITFASGCRLELMHTSTNMPDKTEAQLAHLAFSLPTQNDVDRKLAQLIAAGCRHLDGPRVTGDGYYEACILDPEQNKIEIVEEK